MKELLAERGPVPVMTAEPKAPTRFFSRRKQDLLLGATLMTFAATVVILLSWVGPKEAIFSPLWMIWFLFSVFVLFFDSLVRVARRLFSDDDPVSNLPSPQRTPGFLTQVSPATAELPSMQNVSLTALDSERVNTGEIRQPLSVTDHTTNLLNKK